MSKITAADVYLMKNCKDMKINMNSSQLLYLHRGGGIIVKNPNIPNSITTTLL